MRITDKAFHYVPSFSTDLAKRFKEIIQAQRDTAAAAALVAKNLVVIPLAGRKIN